ncbi:three component ABC system middle component [Paenibacillus ginsengarvi]|uniref:Uncharacterized protein n=1 Tax=Paenibacillus ginsengarvi TaxID=400777 RepID=A0A3B0C6I0_9BACL|nr:three component ABC system middle component [Paenibacillus ginsengarvi]RKN79157.1 hypothetical protein D7M11_20975 [Paenibacillus ginsengarvi]
MNHQSDLYNNEFICAISIYSVLLHSDLLSISKAMLIFPFVSHQGTLDFLKNKNTSIRGLEEFMLKKPGFFSNFNDRFYSFMVLSLNSIMFLKEAGLVHLVDSKLSVTQSDTLTFNKETVGARALSIVEAAPKLAKILISEEKNLYLQLKVRL